MTEIIGRNLGRYHVLEQLGQGGMASVYKAMDTVLGRQVAIKVILPQRQFSEMFIRRFEREAKALAQLSHPNIVRILDYGEENGLPFLVMEYLSGGTLKEKSGQKMPWREAVKLVIPIARALAYAHEQQIVHRDVKPANILLTQSGDPMLSDFGIAKILETEETTDLTGTGVGIGTPDYMAPEQATNESVDHRADLYALGVMLYELITGRKPYQADTPMAVLLKKVNGPLPRPRTFVPDLPDRVENILFRCLQPKPANRYPTTNDLIADLESSLTEVRPGWGLAALMNRYFYPGSTYRSWALWVIPLGLASVGCTSAILLWAVGGLGQQTRATNTPSQVIPPQTVSTQTEVIFVPPTVSEEIPAGTARPLSKTDGMMLISGGEFRMGSLAGVSDAKADERPQHSVSLRPFWMDVNEVTVGAYRQCAIAGACKVNEVRSEDVPSDYFTNPTYEEYPVVDVTWQDASSYCAWRSARLPTEAEWELAAGGVNSLLYPWGNEAGGALNFCDANCPAEWKNTLIDDGYSHRAPVGSYVQGVSPYGMQDMAGNVWEWVADWYAETYYSQTPTEDPTGPNAGTERVVRGGGWDSPMMNVRVAKRFHHRPALYTGSLGFRCAMDESP
jgi:eukaryotic-like serine/threonine-protein kinase